MTEPEERDSWENLERLVEEKDAEGAQALLSELAPGETARAFSRLDQEDQERLFVSLSPGAAAGLVDELPDAQVTELFERLEPDTAAAILRELPSDEQADLLTSLDQHDADQILAEFDPAEASLARQLAAYDADVAGGLMATEFLVYPEGATVGDVVMDLRRRADEYEDEETQYVYVVAPSGALVGVLRLRDLLLSPSRRSVVSVMIANPLTVRAEAPLDELVDLFRRHAFLGLPVVDELGRPLGIVQRAAAEGAAGERSEGAFLRAQGIVGGEEFRSMPILSRAMRRLSWLTPNIGLNVVAASVIAHYEDTISAVVALAFFLPIISDMSGCSGNQAIAVSVRELTLGLVRPTEYAYVWFKELAVGLINGVALAVVITLVAWFWQGNPYLGLAVGAAMLLNTLVAVSIGGVIPLVLRRVGADPALASGPILTTVTDMCGFFLLLSFATALLPRLVG